MPSMLTIYRRHSAECSHKAEGRRWRRCRCPIWVDGTLEGVPIRKSLETRNWQRARDIIAEWEANGVMTRTDDVSVADARSDFLADLRRRNVSPATLAKYEVIWRRLSEFAGPAGVSHVKQFTTADLREFLAAWPGAPITQAKRLEFLRAIFRFCIDSGWIEENPAAPIKAPLVRRAPTMPFSQDQMAAILAACDRYPEVNVRRGLPSRARLRALVLLLRYSGLRIGDAVACEVGRIRDGRLLLYTAKTGVPVTCRLPEFVIEALETMPRESQVYFFWSGNGSLKTVCETWRQRLAWVFREAGIRDGRPHRFRDTFAVELLLAGVPIERVSMLLGHSSIRVTERHYAPWVRARQHQLEADLEQAWQRDPLCQREALKRIQPIVEQ